MSARVCECRFCGKDDLTPQGHPSHETWCDENPNPGIPYDKQEELDLLEDNTQQEGDGSAEHPNPDQSVSSPTEGLPSVEKLAPDKSVPETEVATDGGNDECPLCGHDEVLEAADAKEEYIEAVDTPNPKAVLAYELADRACQNPPCAALWGEKYDEPLPMEAVVSA